ncbi:hypothetical protein [Actinoplanes sichuanensis]|uniref:Lipoprotein n=1 Tax=Actinoplanes sichuanensis TaxID=512349 RepID=A0ABW4AGD6_9ACTN|nr:hypothetical protein [Actinoplanes sichuanensis]
MRIVMRCVAAVASVALAACAPGSGGDPSTEPSSSMSDADLLTLGRQIVQCMRDNGIPDVPEPFVEEHRLKLPEGEQEALEEKYGDEQFDNARTACQDLYDKVPQGALDRGPEEGADQGPGPEDVDALRTFAQCLRDNGVPEWPDPTSDGRFPLVGTPLEKENPKDSPRLKNALDTCRQHWSGPISIGE